MTLVNHQTIENGMEQMSGCKLPAHASGCKLSNSSDDVRPHIALTLEDPFKVLAA